MHSPNVVASGASAMIRVGRWVLECEIPGGRRILTRARSRGIGCDRFRVAKSEISGQRGTGVSRFAYAAVAFAVVQLAPAVAQAQASITGIVRDTSDTVLFGVVVEVSSPALPEKIRTVTTDKTGQYRVADLPVGTYTMTFALPGLATLKREGLELSGTFTATVHAVLRP